MAKTTATLRYRRTSEVDVVGKTADGFKVQNVDNPDDVWVVPYEVFEATYKPFRDEFDPTLEKFFTFHPVKPGQAEIYGEMRSKAKDFAYHINQNVPSQVEREEAIKKLREVMYWANAGIACE